MEPWTVEAETANFPEQRLAWKVRGWRRSRRAVEEVVRELEEGALEVRPDDADE